MKVFQFYNSPIDDDFVKELTVELKQKRGFWVALAGIVGVSFEGYPKEIKADKEIALKKLFYTNEADVLKFLEILDLTLQHDIEIILGVASRLKENFEQIYDTPNFPKQKNFAIELIIRDKRFFPYFFKLFKEEETFIVEILNRISRKDLKLEKTSSLFLESVDDRFKKNELIITSILDSCFILLSQSKNFSHEEFGEAIDVLIKYFAFLNPLDIQSVALREKWEHAFFDFFKMVSESERHWYRIVDLFKMFFTHLKKEKKIDFEYLEKLLNVTPDYKLVLPTWLFENAAYNQKLFSYSETCLRSRLLSSLQVIFLGKLDLFIPVIIDYWIKSETPPLRFFHSLFESSYAGMRDFKNPICSIPLSVFFKSLLFWGMLRRKF